MKIKLTFSMIEFHSVSCGFSLNLASDKLLAASLHALISNELFSYNKKNTCLGACGLLCVLNSLYIKEEFMGRDTQKHFKGVI